MVLKSCKAAECYEPWKVLHPQENIQSLADALHDRYDTFYEDQPKVAFTACELGYIKESEGPQDVDVWGGDEDYRHELRSQKQPSFKYQGHWSLWT